MARVLVYVESRDGVVLTITNELLNAARKLDATGATEVVAVVLSADPQSLAGQIKGADSILTMQHASLSPYNPEAHGRGLQVAIESCNPDLVLLGYTTAGLDLGSLVSVRTSRALVGYCTALHLADGALHATSQLYRGKLVAATKTTLPAVAVVVPGSFDDAPAAGGPSKASELPVPGTLGSSRMKFMSVSVPDSSQVDLTQAERIVCVGRGIGSDDKIAIATELASLLGAEIAGSRPVIDSGWLPKARQVGKSGQKVKPKLYIALGVSGAPEHLEGMKNADYILAVNSDAKAPIFEVAHVGTTCDLFELVPALSSLLSQG